jgi:predicted RNA-binding protein YlqC (UPF0109 family)
MNKAELQKVEEIKNALQVIIQSMILEGNAVIKPLLGDDYAVFFIEVPREQTGRIIGKEGSIIKCFRQIFQMMEEPIGFQCQVEVRTR